MARISPILPGSEDLSEVPELTSPALEAARWNPAVGCLLDRVDRGRPLIICFAYREFQSMQPFDFFGRVKKLEARLDVRFNKILLRDLYNSWYHRGIPGLGADVDEVTDGLRALIDLIRPSRTVTIGQSMGAYAATMYGMLLGVDQIVTFGPLSHLDPSHATRYGDRGFLSAMQDLQANPPRTVYADLLQLGMDVEFRGEQHINFGTHPELDDGVSSNFDAIHALRLAQLPNTFLYPYPEADHRVVPWLVDNAKMDDLLAGLLIPGCFPDRAATTPA